MDQRPARISWPLGCSSPPELSRQDSQEKTLFLFLFVFQAEESLFHDSLALAEGKEFAGQGKEEEEEEEEGQGILCRTEGRVGR